MIYFPKKIHSKYNTKNKLINNFKFHSYIHIFFLNIVNILRISTIFCDTDKGHLRKTHRNK